MSWLKSLQENPSKIGQYFITQLKLSVNYVTSKDKFEQTVHQGTVGSITNIKEDDLLIAIGILAQACHQPFARLFQIKPQNIALPERFRKEASIVFDDNASVRFSLTDNNALKMEIIGLKKSFNMPAQSILHDIQANATKYEQAARSSLYSKLGIVWKNAKPSNDNNHDSTIQIFDQSINSGLNSVRQSIASRTDNCSIMATSVLSASAFADAKMSQNEPTVVKCSEYLRQHLFDITHAFAYNQSLSTNPQVAKST